MSNFQKFLTFSTWSIDLVHQKSTDQLKWRLSKLPIDDEYLIINIITGNAIQIFDAGS